MRYRLLLYADLVRKLVPGKDLRLQFAVITKAKAPKVQLLEASFDENKLDRTKRVFESVWSAIQSGIFYPAPSPMLCPGCGYRSACAAWQG
jgi:CRISPR/Cas system-associated exonuclease Cas4 (RecB family)